MDSQADYLDWISNEQLETAVFKMYTAISNAMKSATLDDLQTQIIDPFSLVFETVTTNTTVEEWLKSEVQRQVQRSWINHVGYFHQEILGGVDGWQDLVTGDDTGLDVIKDDETIFAEIKNKHNTLNSSSAKETHRKLETVANQYPEATVYLVHVIRKRNHPYNEIWSSISFNPHPRVRIISGELFYEIVTGSQSALFDLYNVIPIILKDIINTQEKLSPRELTAFVELQEITQSSNELDYLKYFFDHAFLNSKKK